jgi:hypothetical protein
MCPKRIRIAVLAFGLAALGVAGLPALAGADEGVPPGASGGLTTVLTRVQKKDPEYKLWKYHGGKDKWKETGDTGPSHTDLHKKGKSKGWTHVHPKYWNETFLQTKTGGILFTITLDGNPDPNPISTNDLPKYCLYHCDGDRWTYVTEGTDYNLLYEDSSNKDREGRECNEACGTRRLETGKYFTVCAKDDTLYPDRKCCEARIVEVLAILPACAPVEKGHHCCLFDRLRARRSCR